MIDEKTPGYKPPVGLGNRHLQNLLSSSSFRRALILRQNAKLLRKSHLITLDCGNGVKLMGELNEQRQGVESQGLVILLHGWEGSSRSNYLVSAASQLLRAGFDVFRLNFRDHGDTHHLNRGLFHSALEEEVIGAVSAVQKRWHMKSRYFLAGFSLGGNFALRVALKQNTLPAPLNHVFCVCPVLDPARTMAAMEEGKRLYEGYFKRKWKRSLLKKLLSFNSYDYGRHLAKMKSLREMNEYFIPRYTPLATVEQYYANYTLTGDRLSGLKTPSTILLSADDPLIPVVDSEKLPQLTNLNVLITERGSHCAFLNSYSLASWADQQMIATFQRCAATDAPPTMRAQHRSTNKARRKSRGTAELVE